MLKVDGNENGKKKKNNKQQQTKTKTSRCNLAKKKKTSLHLQHSFWYTSLPLLLQRETSELHVVWRKCRMCTQKILLLVFLLAFFTAPHFCLTVRSQFLFHSGGISCCSSKEIRLLCFLLKSLF